MNTPTLQLKLNSIDLLLPKRNRNIYFILSATTPDNPYHLAVTLLPDTGFLTLGKHESKYSFTPEGDPDGGLFLLSTAMPSSKILEARLWIMESMSGLKTIGKILSGITGFVENKVEGSKLFQAIGGMNPVVVSGIETVNNGLEQIGAALSKIGDKQLGFISMDQTFSHISDPVKQPTITCEQVMLSGNGKISWSWLFCTPENVQAV